MASKHIRAKAPISTHPAFPAIAAAWFGSLLGIGSLLVPVALFEHAAAMSSLTALIPAAEAPLGSTARLIIAAALAVIGSLAGLQFARHLAASQAAPRESQRKRAQVLKNKVPISALDELGAASFDQPVEVGLPALSAQPEAQIPDQDYSAPLQTGCEPASEEKAEVEAPAEFGRITATAVDEPSTAPQPALTRNIGTTAEDLIRRPLDELGIVQLVERFALSLQQRPASAFRRPASDTLDAAQFEGTADAVPVSSAADYPAEMPAALRPIEFNLPSDDWACGDEEEEDEDFSSLLALKRTTAEPRKSVTLPADDECEMGDSVAVFPDAEGQRARRKFDAPRGESPHALPPSAPSSGDETEQKLRGALEQLRKISGTR